MGSPPWVSVRGCSSLDRGAQAGDRLVEAGVGPTQQPGDGAGVVAGDALHHVLPGREEVLEHSLVEHLGDPLSCPFLGVERFGDQAPALGREQGDAFRLVAHRVLGAAPAGDVEHRSDQARGTTKLVPLELRRG